VRRGYEDIVTIGRRGDQVARRSLAFYQAVGECLAAGATREAGDRS
jgi:hypothetical protein